MKCVNLPFLQAIDNFKENSTEDYEFKRSSSKILSKRCLASAIVQQSHERHPFYYQLQFYSKLENVEISEELKRRIYFIKLLALKEGFNFYEFLQICCSLNNLLFNKQSMNNSRESNSYMSDFSFSFNGSILSDNGIKERLNDLIPDIDLNRYENLIKELTLTTEEIAQQIQTLIFNQKSRAIKHQHNSSISTSLAQKSIKQPSTIKADYKLPQFKAKGFLACPKDLKSEIIEFLGNNVEKPYPSAILSLSYFYGIGETIQQSNQLGYQYLKNIRDYSFFDLGQSIIAGLDYGNALLADYIFFILNCNEAEKDNSNLNDDLPLFFSNGLQSNLVLNFFAQLDQQSNQLESCINQFKVWINNKDNSLSQTNKQQFCQLLQVFSQLLTNISENQSNSKQNSSFTPNDQNLPQPTSSSSQSQLQPQSQQNSINLKPQSTSKNETNTTEQLYQIEEMMRKKEDVYAAFSIEMLIKMGYKMGKELDQTEMIDLLSFAADNQHIKAFSKLAIILYNQYYQLDQIQKLKLISYLQQGCRLFIPSCIKVQIQLKIMGDSHIRDYPGAYQMMKDLFYLGSDCFRFDLVRLAKYYKDFSFLSLYCEYLLKSGEKNIDLLQGLLFEKGYGRQVNLNKAYSIYQQLMEKGKKESNYKFDLSLNYRLGKVLKVLKQEKESQSYFESIFSYASHNIQKLDIISIYKIGKLYEKGNGTSQNLRKAEEIYHHILNYDKEKFIFNTNFNISLSQNKNLNENQRLDKKKLSQISTRSLSSQVSMSSRINELDNLEEIHLLGIQNNIKQKFSESRKRPLFDNQEQKQLEQFIGQKEKMWENITKYLTVKKRHDNLKYAYQNKIDENEGVVDIEEYDPNQCGLITHYFSQFHYKPSFIPFQSCLMK